MMMVGLWFNITLNFYKVLTVNEQDNCDEHGNENLYVNYQDSSIDQHNHDLKITDQSILKLYSIRCDRQWSLRGVHSKDPGLKS